MADRALVVLMIVGGIAFGIAVLAGLVFLPEAGEKVHGSLRPYAWRIIWIGVGVGVAAFILGWATLAWVAFIIAFVALFLR
jgi:hypothetical protein